MPNKGKNAHQLSAKLPLNTVVTDNSKKKWKLGASIGKGGFGEIYSGEIKKIKSTPYCIGSTIYLT